MNAQDIAKSLDAFPQELLDAAGHHGDDLGEPGHTVGDLRDMLQACWEVMSPSQRAFVIEGDQVDGIIECGARGEFDVETLMLRLEQQVQYMKNYAEQRGYVIVDMAHGSYWRNSKSGIKGSMFEDSGDAIHEAYLEALDEAIQHG